MLRDTVESFVQFIFEQLFRYGIILYQFLQQPLFFLLVQSGTAFPTE